MSDANVDIVRRGYEALNRRDFEAALELADESVTGTPLFSVEQGVLRGKDEIRALWQSQVEALDLHIEPLELMAVGDAHVLAVTRWIGHGLESRTPVEATTVQVFTVEDGKIVRFETFASKDEALKATAPPDTTST